MALPSLTSVLNIMAAFIRDSSGLVPPLHLFQRLHDGGRDDPLPHPDTGTVAAVLAVAVHRHLAVGALDRHLAVFSFLWSTSVFMSDLPWGATDIGMSILQFRGRIPSIHPSRNDLYRCRSNNLHSQQPDCCVRGSPLQTDAAATVLHVTGGYHLWQVRSPHDLAVIGHIDHGKSTTVGRLLFETGAVPQHVIDGYRKEAESKGKGPLSSPGSWTT